MMVQPVWTSLYILDLWSNYWFSQKVVFLTGVSEKVLHWPKFIGTISQDEKRNSED